MRVGFPVSGPFRDSGGVSYHVMPAGTAAHVGHVGPYSGLRAAHGALNEWCDRRRQERLGLSFEIYGDWNDDESRLVTDVYAAVRGDVE